MRGLYQVFYAADLFIQLISWAILAYCVLSWFRPRFEAFQWLRKFVMPFISPFQRLSLRLMSAFNMPFDFSCWFALIAIRILRRLWWMLYTLIARGIYR